MPKTTERPPKVRDRILTLLADGEPRTSREVAEELGVHFETAQRLLQELAEDGELRRVYRVVSSGAWVYAAVGVQP
ncbi:MAG TPA: helix-turn-helix domain-containing protein [Rhodanobacteraceae bacterium]|nr:helix-turn-helix domain-containing protein [Rhodanobacteraceae bacterium]